jgi:hypothetical protein
VECFFGHEAVGNGGSSNASPTAPAATTAEPTGATTAESSSTGSASTPTATKASSGGRVEPVSPNKTFPVTLKADGRIKVTYSGLLALAMLSVGWVL